MTEESPEQPTTLTTDEQLAAAVAAQEAAQVSLDTAQTSLEAATAVVSSLSGETPEPPDPEPPVTGRRVLYGSSAEASGSGGAEKAWSDLEGKLKAQSGQSGPVLMFDHRYDGDTIARSIPGWWAGKGLRFGMLNGKGPMTPTSSAFANLPALAGSLPAGFTLYAPWWHEPEDNQPASKFIPAFAAYVAAVKAIPASAFKSGAKIVPMFNLHGSMFRKGSSMYEKWGPLSSWNPYPAIPAADRGLVVATINGYADPASTGSSGENAAWTFGEAFTEMRKWGATRLGICEFGFKPRQSGLWLTQVGDFLQAQPDVEVACYFSSGVGGNAGTDGWALDTPASQQAYAAVCLAGRRS